MRKDSECSLNYFEMTPNEYAKQYRISPATVRRRCEMGLIDAYKINNDLKNSHWRIKVPKGDTVSKAEYEKLVKENAELKAIMNSIRKMLS